MSSVAEFYARVAAQELRITEMMLGGDPAMSYHPKPVDAVNPTTFKPEKRVQAVYICSLENFERHCSAGSVCLATPRLAATKIVENTHRLATADEVAGYQQLQADNKARADAEDANRGHVFRVQLPPESKKQ